MASSRNTRDFHCTICMYDFDDPRLLSCLHTFCRRCLDEVISVDYKDGSFACPLCKENVTVPRNGTKGLPVNSFLEKDNRIKDISCDVCDQRKQAVSKCRECNQNFCSSCADIHERMQGTVSHSVYPIESRPSPRLPSCKQHVEEKLEFYCETCDTVVCQICIKFSHKSHPIQDVSSVAEVFKDEISPLVKTTRSSDSRSYKLQVAKQEKNITFDEDIIMDAINKQTEKFQNVVDEVRSDFVRQLLEAISDSNNELKDNKDIVDKNCAAVDNLHHFARYLVRNGNDCDVVKYGPILKQKLDTAACGNTRLLDMQKIDFIPKEISLADVKKLFGFFTPAKYDFAFSGGVNIIQSFHCSLEDCTITSMAAMSDNTIWVCLGNNGVLERYSYTGLKKTVVRLEHRIDDIVADDQCVLYVTCNSERKILTFNRQNAYKRKHFVDTEMCVRGIAIDKDNNNLIIGMTERDVFFDNSYPQIGCIANVSSEKTVEKFHSDLIVQYPARVAVNDTGAVAVSDWIGLCVVVFRKNRKIGYFDGKGCGFSQFLPRGICTTNDGNFIVVNTASNCLHWISENGDLIRTVKSKNGIGEPYSVTLDKHDAVWIGTKDGRIIQLCI